MQSVFSEDITASVDVNDLTIHNDTTNTNLSITRTLTKDGANRKATWSFTNNDFPDGDYTGTILASAVNDVAGNHPASNLTFTFFFLNADANRDGVVDTIDFNYLAANFGTTGKTFTQGNFNYDGAGTVDSLDFSVLASRFGKSIQPLPAAAAARSFLASTPPPPAPHAMATSFSMQPIKPIELLDAEPDLLI